MAGAQPFGPTRADDHRGFRHDSHLADRIKRLSRCNDGGVHAACTAKGIRKCEPARLVVLNTTAPLVPATAQAHKLMNLSELKFNLPPKRIAQRPLAERDASRMLLLDRVAGTWEDRRFREFPDLLRGNELIVIN